MIERPDLVIRGGTIADGSGGPLRKADIAITGGRIAAVGEATASGREEIDARGLDPAEVEDAVALEVARLPGVAAAISTTALLEGRAPELPLVESVRYNLNPSRSGDIFIVFEPGHFINDFDGLTVAATHGSPWSYDTYVPILFMGPGIPRGTVYRHVGPQDVAPTLAAYLGIKAPSGCTGEVLVEVFP